MIKMNLFLRRVVPSVAIVIVSASSALAQYLNGQAATSVLGHTNFTTSFGVIPPTATSLRSPSSIAIDPTTGAVFVADRQNNRILRYSSTAALQTGAAAVGVLGQASFTTLTAATTAGGLRGPLGVYVDPFGRLWVADTENNRVLWFDDAATKSGDVAANGVIGQTNFTNGSSSNAASGMGGAAALLVDPAGHLWVSEPLLNRVRKYTNAVNPVTGAVQLTSGAASASLVLGQSNFVNVGGGVAANRLSGPTGLVMDAAGTLWVADTMNNRVLGFANASTINAFNASATRVLGQADFASLAEGAGRDGLYRPEGLFVNGAATLFVADRANNRVVVHFGITTKADGADADRVIGQPNFTDSFPSTSATRFDYPIGLTVDAQSNLLVVDRQNNRVLRFPPVSIPAVSRAPARLRVKVGRRAVATYTLTNTNHPGRYRLTLPRTNRNVTVTSSFPNGGTTALLPIGGKQVVRVTFRGRRAAARAISAVVTARAVAVPNRTAAAVTRVTVIR